MAATKTLKRTELYALVWQQPMARLAQKALLRTPTMKAGPYNGPPGKTERALCNLG